MTYFWLFLDLFFFCYISFVNFERVCRPNQMTQRLEIWYMGSLYGHKLIPEISYQYSEYNFRFCGKNEKLKYINIICDFTKYRHFLNRNLSSLRRQSVYENPKPIFRSPKNVLTNNVNNRTVSVLI